LAPFIVVALHSGRRSGAILDTALHRSKDHAFVLGDTWYPRPGRVENNKRQPAVRWPPRLLAHINRWRRMGRKFIVEWPGERVKQVGHGFGPALADAGLDDDVSPHILRHTCVTWLLREGVEPWKVAGFVGMGLAVLERVYGHHIRHGAVDAIAHRRREPEKP